jgi:hypothetical protein
MLVSIVLGVLAIRRKDFVRHSAWMTRAYAIAVAAGTQALVIGPWILLAGPPSELIRALLMGLAWVINLTVAEFVIHRRTQAAAPPRGTPHSQRIPDRRDSASTGSLTGWGR